MLSPSFLGFFLSFFAALDENIHLLKGLWNGICIILGCLWCTVPVDCSGPFFGIGMRFYSPSFFFLSFLIQVSILFIQRPPERIQAFLNILNSGLAFHFFLHFIASKLSCRLCLFGKFQGMSSGHRNQESQTFGTNCGAGRSPGCRWGNQSVGLDAWADREQTRANWMLPFVFTVYQHGFLVHW